MGSGYRTFTAGEVLTASNVQNYLQDQAVMVFAGTAARSSAIGTANFEEGMLTYLTDVDKLQVYTGATFADVYPAAASTQGLTLINTTSFSGVSSQSINNVFSATYTNYRIVTQMTSTTAAQLQMRLRVSSSDNSSSEYRWGGIQRTNNTGAIDASYSNPTATNFEIMRIDDALGGGAVIDIYNPFTAIRTSMTLTSAGCNTSNNEYKWINGQMTVTTSYTGFSLIPQSGNITGSVSVYGYNV